MLTSQITCIVLLITIEYYFFVQVWTIKPDGIKCIDVYDVKEAVYELAANAKLACYVTQGTGVKASLICCRTIHKEIYFHLKIKLIKF